MKRRYRRLAYGFEWTGDNTPPLHFFLHFWKGGVGKIVGTVKKMPDHDYWSGSLWDGEPTVEDCGRFPSREEAQASVLAKARVKHQ